MKKIYYSVIIILTIVGGLIHSTFANQTSLNKEVVADQINLNEQASKFMTEKNTFGFRENKGQMEGSDKNSASFVLFKAESNNLNIWITTTGLTYQFLKFEKASEINTALKIQHTHTNVEKDAIQKNIEWHRVDMVLKGASIKRENVITEGDLTNGQINYYHANSPSGIFNVHSYSKITIRNVYPGIDWQLYVINNALEHDFIVHPYANPRLIKLIYEGNGSFIGEEKNIVFKNDAGEVAEGKLLCYQGDKTKSIVANYTYIKNESLSYLGAGNTDQSSGKTELTIKNNTVFSYEVSIQAGVYNRGETLIIDPALVWATYYGGAITEQPRSIACDKDGNVFIVGAVSDVGFPTQSWGSAYYQTVFGGNLSDAFILCFTNGGVLRWATYYGGADSETANSVACDANNNVYITGLMTMSPGVLISTFPLQNLAGAYNEPSAVVGDLNTFILRFNSSTGVRIWGTFCAAGEGRSVTCDASGNVLITGGGAVSPAQSWGGAYMDSTFGGGFDVFILRFSNTGALTWATNYGGPNYEEGIDITTDENGNIYVTGSSTDSLPIFNRSGAFNEALFTGGNGDGFILRFSNVGVLTWATYYPGTEQCTNIACDLYGNVYVTGYSDDLSDGPLQTMNRTGAYNQPITGGDYDACIMRFDPAGALTWSTYFGGAGAELIGNFSYGSEMAIDPCGNVNISLTTLSTNPTTIYAYSSCGQYAYTGTAMGPKTYLLKFTDSGAISWGTLYGGNGASAGWGFMLALDKDENLFVTKAVYEPIFPWPFVNPGGGAYYDTIPDLNDDIYVAKFAPIRPLFTQSQVNDSACSCGSATITLTCGEPNYNYVWSNGSQTLGTDSISNTITGLIPGTYSVTATSACHENVTATFTIIGVTAGIEDGNSDAQFAVYPNPTNGSFNIFVKSPLENSSIEIYNTLGAIVFKQKIVNELNTIKLTSLANGLYFIKVISENKTIASQKIIKQ